MPTRIIPRVATLVPIVAVLCAALLRASPAQAETPRVPTGTYAIAEAQDLEPRALYHFMYLHPSGRFLMAAEWPQHESSRAAGHWRVSTGSGSTVVVLTGTAHVATSQGTWDVDFRRTYRVEESVGTDSGAGPQVRLAPEPEKNRFGMLGWPNGYVFKSAQPSPTLPGGSAGGAVPTDEAKLIALIDSLLSSRATPAR